MQSLTTLYRQGSRQIQLMLFALFTVLVPASTYSQGSQIDPIVQALQSGDADGIAKYFGPSVDITLNNTTSTYSPAQGKGVIREFFQKNSVKGFEIQHSSNSTNRSSTFTIGALITQQGRYKVYLWLKPRDGSLVIKEIRFEK